MAPSSWSDNGTESYSLELQNKTPKTTPVWAFYASLPRSFSQERVEVLLFFVLLFVVRERYKENQFT